MAYVINREFDWNQINMTSDSGVKYKIILNETSQGSNIWVLNFILDSNKSNSGEIFKTMSLMFEVLNEKNGLIEKNNITEIISVIQGEDRYEIDKKTKVFTRWIKSPWVYEIKKDPIIEIEGKSEKIYLKTNLIHMKKTEIKNNNNLKFCFNCGVENKEYKFCPNCGTNLKQA